MGMIRTLLLVLFLTVCSASVCQSQIVSPDSLTVAGFVNLGDASHDYIQVMMTTYLTRFLSKIFSNVPSYSVVEKIAYRNAFWSSRQFDVLKAISIADELNTRYCITGHYQVKKDRSIELLLYIYDVKTHSLQLERTYRNQSVQDVFASIDVMVRDILFMLIGKSVEFGRLKISVSDGFGKYAVVLNGSEISEVAVGKNYESLFVAGQTVDVVLKKKDDGPEVFHETFRMEKDKISEIVYKPVGSILVKYRSGFTDVYLNGKIAGRTDQDGVLFLTGVDALKPVDLEIRENGQTLIAKKARLKEGAMTRVEMAEISIPVHFALPVQFGMKGLFRNFYAGAGVELDIAERFRVFVGGGTVFYSYADTGFGVIPFAEAGVGIFWDLDNSLQLGLDLFAEMFILDRVSLNPALTVDLLYGRMFLSAGVRVSFEPTGGGLYPMASLGYRF